MAPLKTFADGSFLEYGAGNFDNWCVYLTRPGRPRVSPKDVQCLRELGEWGLRYGSKDIYADFVAIYDRTGTRPEGEVLRWISRLAARYRGDSLPIDILYSTLYLAMIAEEQKANTRLGKRIKRLGVHVKLCENKDAAYAADFMRGRPWREIDRMCRVRGF